MHAPCSLLVLDLDGTLLDARGRVSSRNVAAVAAAEAAGVPVVVASGRSWHESRAALGQLGYRRPMVAAGGSVLSDGATGRSLVRFGMSMSLVHDVVGSLLRHRHPVLLLKDAPSERDHYIVVGDLPLDPASEWWFKTFGVRYQRVTNVLDDPHPEDTVRVGVVATGSMLSAIAEEVRG
ncbi:MAG: HAD hydrolase family protein, partial [Propionibacteriaceae bacterium]|nr:HAD hydrolase family protein [Propionibacteriaceae bacterium]